MNAVRQHILEILKEHSCATVAELADHLEMAPVSVRHHLDILQGDNLIRVERLARTGSVGRPQQVYALTRQANEFFPDNSAALASELLKQLKSRLPKDEFNQALLAVASEFTTAFTTDGQSPTITDERMDHIVEFLNERGYLARWEPDEHREIDVLLEQIDTDAETDAPAAVTYLLHKCHCPYSCIEAESNELCQMDQALIEHLLGQSCERINTIAEDAPCCTYRIVAPIDKSVESLASVESVEESVIVPSV